MALITPTAPNPSKIDGELSIHMTVVLVFVTHGIVNSLLLAFSPIRCAYWNKKECDADEEWIMNWLAYGFFHVNVLIAGLAYKARGHVILEQRLLFLVTAMILSYLTSGVFMLDDLEPTLAGVQLVVYLGLLLVVVYNQATSPFVVPLPAQLRNSSFDHRKQLSIPTIAVSLQFVLATFQLWDMTFGNGRSSYMGDHSSVVYQSISHAAVSQMFWVAVILGTSIVLATPDQHKSMLLGETISLFIALYLMSGDQGARMDPAQARAACIGTFFSMLIAMFGSY